MKPGLTTGSSQQIEIEVTAEMRAALSGDTIHGLCSTSALVGHMESEARKMIEPYLEETEECLTYHVDLSHFIPTLVGMKLKLKSTVSEVRDNKYVFEIEAHTVKGKVSRCFFTHAIVQKTWLNEKMKEISIINQLAAPVT